MKRRPNPATCDTHTPFEQMVREIARYGLGLFVVATLALCMLALALADVPGSRP
ncbi:hypothetical protein [Variovorax boronicumulans]